MLRLILLSFVLILSGCTKVSSQFCEQIGGKWGNVNTKCIRPSCAKTKTCGTWANPAEFCQKIKIGDSKDYVRFWLGEPINESQNQMIWTDKLSEYQVKAEFSNNILTRLECPK